MSEDEHTINEWHYICVVHIGMHIVCEYDVNILCDLEIRSNVKVLKVTYIHTYEPTKIPTYPHTHGNHHRIGSAC